MTKLTIKLHNCNDYYLNDHLARLDGKQNSYDTRFEYFISGNIRMGSNTLDGIKKTNNLANIKKDII